MANIFLNKWEGEDIFGRCWPQILLYKRFIDDILIIWEGDRKDINAFMEDIGSNKYGIKFTLNTNNSNINFLDLKMAASYALGHTSRILTETDTFPIAVVTTYNGKEPYQRDNL